jgi:hypothetical protein
MKSGRSAYSLLCIRRRQTPFAERWDGLVRYLDGVDGVQRSGWWERFWGHWMVQVLGSVLVVGVLFETRSDRRWPSP